MNEADLSGRERRKFRRISRSFVARALPQGASPDQGWHIVFIRNISKGGVLFSSDRNYSSGAVLRISIDILNTQKHVECTAKVVRCQAAVESQIFDVAVKFMDLKPEDSALLEKSIDDYLQRLGELGVSPE